MAPPRRRPAVSRSQIAEQHLTWLQALPGDGPFLTIPVLTAAFPTGLELTTPERAAQFKHAYAAYRTAPASKQEAARQSFITTTVRDVLDWGTHYDPSEATTDRFTHTTAAFNVTTTPAFALWPDEAAEVADDALPVMLGYVWPSDVTLTRRMLDGWAATPIDRAAASLRHHNIPLGIVTNGRSWVVVWAPRGSATGWVLFDTHAMLDDRQLLDAFTSLLARRRHLAVAETETLNALLNAALDSQEELTENLSIEVRKAVEMLVDSIGAADKDSGGQALAGIDADHVYQGAVTIVMRLVFLLAAEERRLLPGDDDVWIANYGIAGLADRLIETANHYGEDVLARQSEAFQQVLATSRIVHDGVRHQTLNVKGYGGSVFDPDRYPWLEGRQPGGPGKPVHVDDRTMLHILTGLTRWQGRRLAYRTLDVEQIGYVYEGLLDHTAVKADTTYLGLAGKHEPEVPLEDLEDHADRGGANLRKWVKDTTGLTAAQVNRALADGVPELEQDRLLLAACGGDQDLAARIRPYLALLRTDERSSQPIVYLPGDWFVTKSEARSGSGSYYTPRSLAEEVVKHTLGALVYDPGSRQTLDEDQWRIITPEAILDLKIADIAMGSGAFLVAADRYLADRLIEALNAHPESTTDPALLDLAGVMRRSAESHLVSDQEADEVTLTARRLIATRCLYGADINPMAVEMAKLSLWLATAAKDRPFGFLDHHLAVGDSLLGLTDVRQIENVHPDPAVGARIHASSLTDQTAHIRSALERAIGKRQAIESMRVYDLRDVEQQQALLADSNRELADLGLLADAVTAAVFSAAQNNNRNLDQNMLAIGADGGELVADEAAAEQKELIRETFRSSVTAMQAAAPDGGFERRPIQWIIQFPEVFLTGQGFDGVIGNPPYLGGTKISGAFGADYRRALSSMVFGRNANRTDLVGYFTRRMARLSRGFGVVATRTLSETDTSDNSLRPLLDSGWTITKAFSDLAWPSRSALGVRICLVWMTSRGLQSPPQLDGQSVSHIDANLTDSPELGTLFSLDPEVPVYEGVKPAGKGFLVGADHDPEEIESVVLREYLTGSDLNDVYPPGPSRRIIDFTGMQLSDAEELAPRALERLRVSVKPLRDKASPEIRRINWWTFLRPRQELRSELIHAKRYWALPRHGSALAPSLVPSEWLPSEALVAFPRDSMELGAHLVGAPHQIWAIHHCGTFGQGLRYTSTDVWATYPYLELSAEACAELETLLRLRDSIQARTRLTITEICRRLHAGEWGDDLSGLAEAHIRLDKEVLATYGIEDPTFDFRDTRKVGQRWGPDATTTRRTLLRLADLNREMHRAGGDFASRSGSVKASGRTIPQTYKEGEDDGATLFD